MKNTFLFLLILNFLYAMEPLPNGWPWKGIDIKTYAVESDPTALQFIIDNNIKYVRIHFHKTKVMKVYGVSGEQALELNLKWAKIINDKLSPYGIKSFITLPDFPVSLKECINKKESIYWQSKSCIEQIYHDVNRTVDYFKNSNILGYEFLGEPVVKKNGKAVQPENWNDIFRNIIKITRQTDKDKWLFYSPGPWGLPIKYDKVVPFNDLKIIYNAHMYAPHRYTHQGMRKNKNLYSYPGMIGLKYWDKKELQKSLIPLINFQKKYKKPIAISEFSVALWAEGNNKYLTDLIEIFNEHQWSWMYFNVGSIYKGWDARYDAILDKKKRKRKKKIFTYRGNKSKRFQAIKPFLQSNENSKILLNKGK